MHKRSSSKLIELFILMLLVAVVLMIAFPRQVHSHAAGQSNPDEYQISVNVGLVVLPVVVTNGKGKEVSGLDEGSFHIYEDGQPQRISFFEPEDVPVTVGLAIDNSGSMRFKRAEVTAAAEKFAESSNPRDEMFVVNFNQRASLGLPKGIDFTHDLQQILDAVARTPATGNTALYDGLALALAHINSGTASRKALIVISDGDDNASRMNLPALLKRAEASNTQIYTLGVFDDNFSGAHSQGVLRRISKVTAGKAYFPESPGEIATICTQIAENLRHQYTIGYVPNSPGPTGKYHAIRVTADNAGNGKLHVSTRAGYLMPSDLRAETAPAAKASL